MYDSRFGWPGWWFWIALQMGLIDRIDSRGRPISLYDQPGNLHRGPGDIANLWPDFGLRAGLQQLLIARNAIKPDSSSRWTRYKTPGDTADERFIIPFVISGKFDSAEHATIARAMQAIADNTCIKFERRAGEADYVDLRNERGEGCYTVVGRSPGRNTVMLETNEIATCLEFDIVIHELMHTIGLWHEQMRYDRDDHIKIHYENIAPAYITQFEKVPDTDSTTYGVRYDYRSVMHYAKDAFATAPGKITMETLDKHYQEVIGRVNDASPGDYLKVCNIYACRTCMGKPFAPGGGGRNAGSTVAPPPPPAGTPLPTRTTTAAPNPGDPTTPPSPTSTHASAGGDPDRGRPTPLLPIILPLINNGWWWKNTPAPPLVKRRDADAASRNASENAQGARQRDCREASFCALFFPPHNRDALRQNTSQQAATSSDALNRNASQHHDVKRNCKVSRNTTVNDSGESRWAPRAITTSKIAMKFDPNQIDAYQGYATTRNASQPTVDSLDVVGDASQQQQRNARSRDASQLVVGSLDASFKNAIAGNASQQQQNATSRDARPQRKRRDPCELAMVRRHCCRCEERT